MNMSLGRSIPSNALAEKNLMEKTRDDAQNVSTIDQMSYKVKRLFVFIKNQLTQTDHPLNVISKQFSRNYVEFYINQI